MSIEAPATNPASDLALKLPATVGAAGQVLKNSSTAGTLEFGAGGITHIDTWRLDDDLTIPDGYITQHWSRATDTLTAQLGAAVTESSGLFTLPETGIWRITCQIECYSANECRWIDLQIRGSTDGFSSDETTIATGFTALFDTSGNVHQSCRTSCYYDCTNTGNNKIKVFLQDTGSGGTTESAASRNVSWIEFVKVAET